MSRPSQWEREAAKVTREVTRRAIRRLDVLEWVMLGVATALAIGGGMLVALLISGRSHPMFRTIWLITSLVLFVVPGAVALARWRREERERAKRLEIGKDGDG